MTAAQHLRLLLTTFRYWKCFTFCWSGSCLKERWDRSSTLEISVFVKGMHPGFVSCTIWMGQWRWLTSCTWIPHSWAISICSSPHGVSACPFFAVSSLHGFRRDLIMMSIFRWMVMKLKLTHEELYPIQLGMPVWPATDEEREETISYIWIVLKVKKNVVICAEIKCINIQILTVYMANREITSVFFFSNGERDNLLFQQIMGQKPCS